MAVLRWGMLGCGNVAEHKGGPPLYSVKDVEEYLADDVLPFFLKCLQTFIASQGGVSELSKNTGIDAETLSNMLSNDKSTN